MDDILGRPPQHLEQRRWFGPRPELPHERSAHELARESPWPWQEILPCLSLLHGDTVRMRTALRLAATMNLTLLDAANQVALMEHING